jgi:hypothetical protein
VTQVVGQHRHAGPGIDAGVVPVDQGPHGETVAVMRNSALETLCGRLGYVPCREVSAGRSGGARIAVRIIPAKHHLVHCSTEQG